MIVVVPIVMVVEIAIRREQQDARAANAAAAGWYERVKKRPRAPVVAQDAPIAGVRSIGDVQVVVGAEHEADRDAQPTAPPRNELVHERAGGPIVAQDSIRTATPDVQVAVRPERQS